MISGFAHQGSRSALLGLGLALVLATATVLSTAAQAQQSLTNQAADLYEAGRYAEAEVLFRQALEERERTLGPEHTDTLRSLSNLAATLNRLGRSAEAE